MRPKEYYEQNTIQEDARYIFTLVPPEFEKQYKKYIKEPIEKIKLGDGKLTCSSHIEFEAGTEQLPEIWKSIQKASVIIANITGFNTNVMFALGVALMKKGRVILIAEKSLDGNPKLPFNISTLKVEFYEPGKLNEFSDRLLSRIETWLAPDKPKIKDLSVRKLMNDVFGLRRGERYGTALLLLEYMDKTEPENWYIYKEWGKTYKENKDYDKACKKLQKSLEYTKCNTHKSEIYTELGTVYRDNNMVDHALVTFEKAENLDRENAELYEKWAFLYYNMGKYQDAMNKMTMAVKLDENNEVRKWKFEFYAKKFADNNFRMGLGKFLASKRDEKTKKREKKSSVHWSASVRGRPKEYYEKSNLHNNNPNNFKRFINRHKTKEIMEGEIIHVDSRLGVFVRFDPDISGLIFKKRLPGNFDMNDRFQVGNKIRTKLLSYNYDRHNVILDMVDVTEKDDKLLPSETPQTFPDDLSRYTKVDCPKKCSLNDEIELSVHLTIKKPLETVVRKFITLPKLSSNESIKLTLQVTAIGFHIDNQRKTMNVPVNDDSEKVKFKMKALSVGDQPVEVEIYFNALRIGYFGLEIQVEEDSNGQS